MMVTSVTGKQAVKYRSLHKKNEYFTNRIRSMKNVYDACKCNMYLVDYRGFGLSSGNPYEKGKSNI